MICVNQHPNSVEVNCYLVLKIAVICTFGLAASAYGVTPDTSASSVRLKSGAIELGFAGALTVVEGSSSATASTRVGGFVPAPAGLIGLEVDFAFTHINSLSILDIQPMISWQKALGKSAVYPFLAVAAGVRQEWLGSFQQVRYPVGISLGLRNLITNRIGVRTEYRFRRILGDPVAKFTEHMIVLGIVILFRNSAVGAFRETPLQIEPH